MNANYEKAVDYAFHLTRAFGKDLVHDAYLTYYDKNKRHLFDESEKTMMNFIRKTYWKKYSQKSAVVFTDRVKQNLVTPEDEYIEHELGLSFVNSNDIEQAMNSYAQYHVMFPKIHLN